MGVRSLAGLIFWLKGHFISWDSGCESCGVTTGLPVIRSGDLEQLDQVGPENPNRLPRSSLVISSLTVTTSSFSKKFPLSCNMSARKSFFPQNSASSSVPPPALFVPDQSNPLHSSSNGSFTAPFDIPNLLKPQRSQQHASQGQPPSRRQSMNASIRPSTGTPHAQGPTHSRVLDALNAAGLITRPGTSDPHKRSKNFATHRLQSHGPSGATGGTPNVIAAPSPRMPASALFREPTASPAGAFKPSAPIPVSQAVSMTPTGEQPQDEAHIFGFNAAQEHPDASNNRPLSRSLHSAHVHPHLEEDSDEPPMLQSRSPFLHQDRVNTGVRGTGQQDDDVYEIPEAEVRARGSNLKRGRSEVEDGEGDDHGMGYGAGQAKRFKAQEQLEDSGYERMALPDPTHPRQDVEHHHQLQHHHDGRPQRVPPSTYVSYSGRPYDSIQPISPSHQEQACGSDPDSHAERERPEASPLLKLLRVEQVDLLSAARVDKYIQSTEKWKNCTREEWIAGADELMRMYTKIFDFLPFDNEDRVLTRAQNRVSIEHTFGCVRNARFIIDPNLDIPRSLRVPFGPSYRAYLWDEPELDPNLSVNVWGQISADIDVRPRLPPPADEIALGGTDGDGAGTSLDVDADGKPHSPFMARAVARARERRLEKRRLARLVHIEAKTRTGDIELHVHSGAGGPISLTAASVMGNIRIFLSHPVQGQLVVRAPILGRHRVTLSPRIQATCGAPLHEAGRTTHWLVGDTASRVVQDGEGDRITVEASLGSVWIGYVDETPSATAGSGDGSRTSRSQCFWMKACLVLLALAWVAW
ncbi:unnamed protein product [Mycena citricolor]|uniref:DUF7330 domain-containing protein n=1 Tax=Mycena citricolor TaxID=2018698 RepID=A0AAD2HDA9_9AGAR|nr:unnamed protein product [Mycena citricolor]CAK5272763.1 unnamed protein product [Mycena citricolor]